MSTTAQDIITGALIDLGELGQGEPPSTEDLNYGLIRLNGIIDSWSTQRLFLYTVSTTLLNLVGSQQFYTFGPTGNFASYQPVLVQSASIVVPGTTIRIPLNMLTAKQWATIPEKGLTGVLPTDAYFDGNYPNLGFWLSPIPSGTPQMEIYYWAPLTQFAAIGSTFSMPPGYLDALKYTLMLHLSQAYDKPIDPILVQLAKTKTDAINTINAQILSGSFGESRTLHGPNIGAAVTPPALTPGGQGGEPGPVIF